MKKVPETIEAYVKGKVTVNAYKEELPIALGYRSERGLTQLFASPEKASFQQIKAIAQFCECDANFLIDTYKLGLEKLTVSQRNLFLKYPETQNKY